MISGWHIYNVAIAVMGTGSVSIVYRRKKDCSRMFGTCTSFTHCECFPSERWFHIFAMQRTYSFQEDTSNQINDHNNMCVCLSHIKNTRYPFYACIFPIMYYEHSQVDLTRLDRSSSVSLSISAATNQKTTEPYIFLQHRFKYMQPPKNCNVICHLPK